MAKNTARRIGFWVIMSLLFVGLIGFGATGLTGNARTVAEVGEVEIDAQDYANGLNNQLRSFEAQIGQALTLQQAFEFGLDRAVLGQLVGEASLDNETRRIGLSVGDLEVRNRVLSFREFQGLDGSFDRETYRFALSNSGLSESEFEADVRDDAARALLQGAVIGGVPEPVAYAETLAGYIGERRDISWLTIDEADLTDPVPPADLATLESFHAENQDRFTSPEVREISYAWLTPEMLQDSVEVDEELVRDLYDQRDAEYNRPERRLVERLVMPNEEAAATARAALDAGETDFETLVSDRGLALADTDMGDVTRGDLGAAADTVFEAEPGVVLGPLPTDLGPAFFRVNAVLAAEETTFEEAAPDLRAELAEDRARRQIGEVALGLEDLLAGGASIEDIAERTELELGSIRWSEGETLGIAAYDTFREAAAAAEAGAFPELVELPDGGVFVLRLDEVVPAAPRGFEEARPEVEAAWRAAATGEAVQARARAIAALARLTDELKAGERLAETETGLIRRDFVPGTPDGFLAQVFEMEEGEVRVLPGPSATIVVRLDAVAPADMESETIAAERAAIADRVSEGIARDLYEAYTSALLAGTPVRVNEGVINAVHANFR